MRCSSTYFVCRSAYGLVIRVNAEEAVLSRLHRVRATEFGEERSLKNALFVAAMGCWNMARTDDRELPSNSLSRLPMIGG